MKVYLAISQVAAKLAKEGISKGRKNVQQGYQFRGIDDVFNALSPFLVEAKLCILPTVLERECVERQTKSGGALFYVTVKVRFDFISAEDQSKHEVVTYGEAMDSADKATNKAMSAAYKYAAMQAFCIPTEGDNDADSTTHEVKAQDPVAVALAKANIKPTTGAREALKPEQLKKVEGVASSIIDAFEANWGAETVLQIIDEAELDNDEKVAMWTYLDSKQRSAIKKAAEARKQPVTA
jgi:hypothetical protein